MTINDDVLLRFIGKIKSFEKDKCWEWSGYKRKDGYANFWIKDKVYLAHRISYMISRGNVDKKTCVCHTCDNRSCINPDHLWTGTQADNMRDCAKKGRIVNKEMAKTHCSRGHEYTHIYIKKTGGRTRKCRICDAINARLRTVKKNASR
jgi:hypothetical protein